MKIVHLTREQWWDFANEHYTATLFRWWLAAIELAKVSDIPAGALGYSEESDILYVADDHHET